MMQAVPKMLPKQQGRRIFNPSQFYVLRSQNEVESNIKSGKLC